MTDTPLSDGELYALIDKARAAYEAMSPVDKALADSDQRRSWVRGEVGHAPADVLADEVRHLRSQLEAARKVIEPFGKLHAPTMAYGAVVSEHAYFTNKVKAADIWAAATWLKDNGNG
jgi:hypothetical protein